MENVVEDGGATHVGDDVFGWGERDICVVSPDEPHHHGPADSE